MKHTEAHWGSEHPLYTQGLSLFGDSCKSLLLCLPFLSVLFSTCPALFPYVLQKNVKHALALAASGQESVARHFDYAWYSQPCAKAGASPAWGRQWGIVQSKTLCNQVEIVETMRSGRLPRVSFISDLHWWHGKGVLDGLVGS